MTHAISDGLPECVYMTGCAIILLLLMLLQAMSGNPHDLHSSQTAVAVGIASAEYNNYTVPRHTAGVGVYSATGGALSVASGRLSYTFGLKGPAMRSVSVVEQLHELLI